MKTLRLIYPDWQAGAKEAYYFGGQLLQFIAPKNDKHIERIVDIKEPDGQPLGKEDGITAKSDVINNIHKASQILNEEQPDHIITLGGNCIVSQAPFDYLHGKYQDLGIIWIDAHPDISTSDIHPNAHAMVVASLIGKNDDFKETIQHPFNSKDVLYLGLSTLTNAEVLQMNKFNMNYVIQKEHLLSYDTIQQWIHDNNYKHVVIHFDLDSISPTDFYSLYYSETHITRSNDSAYSRHTLEELVEMIIHIQDMSEIVGLTIAEYLPWDAIRLNKTMKLIKIFNE